MTKVVHLYASQRVSRRAKDGIDGTSVTIINKSVTYQISESGTETPTGNWSDKVVATTDTKPYLWTRTIVVYSDTNSTTSYSVSYKGKDGAPGKDAYRVEISPSTLVFDTNDNGVVDGSALGGKYATVTVYKGSQKISVDNLSLPSNYATKKHTNVDGRIYNNNGEARITITEIEQETISGDEKVSKSSGQISFPIDVLGERSTLMWVTVNVQVNVAKFTGSVVANNKKYETNFTEISNRFENTPTNGDLTKAESRITQTAREISLSVSEKTIGRRNLLVGSAFRRQGEVSYISNSHPYFIRINDGYGGTNCAYMSKSGMTQNVWCGAMWNPVTVKPNTKYTFSMMLKVTSACDERFDVQFIDVTSSSSNTDAFNTLAAANKTETFGWTLKKMTITTPSSCTKLRIDAFVRRNGKAYMCRPMLEEGDYNGWTLSQDDYDYIGGNMLDNTLSLDKSGTLYEVNGTLTPLGFGESTSIYKSFAYKLKGTVDSFSQLPTSGNVYNDTYYVRNDGTCYAYNGSKFEDVGNDYYFNVLEWRKGKSGAFSPFGLEANKDYVFSFMAKGTGKITAYFYNPDTDVFVESSLGAIYITVDGSADFQLTNEWRRYWVHWRPSDSLHKYILLRLDRTIQSIAGDSPITDCYIAQPKLEEGATMTEFTERKTDLVDKASLKKAGIEITSEQVTLYGNKVQVKTPKENPSEGYDEAAMFQNGKLNANLIDAKNVVTQGLRAGDIDAERATIKNLSIIGSSRNPFTRMSEGTNVDYSNNVSVITNINHEFVTSNYELKWDNSQNGRRITLLNYRWHNELADGGATIKAPGGKYFFEDGLKKSALKFSRQYVELLGIGDDTDFYGWVVVNKVDVCTVYGYGHVAKVLAYGSLVATIENNKLKLTLSQKTFDGKKITVEQAAIGYKLRFPSSWGNAGNFVPNITPYKFIGNIYIYERGYDYIIIRYSGRSSENRNWEDASFLFSIQTAADFNWLNEEGT